jgi:hypothetical protein
MRILPHVQKQVTVLAAAALALAGAAALGAAAPSGAAVHRAPASRPADMRTAGSTVDGLVVKVGYAENKSGNAPPAGAFPTPWSGAASTTFLGAPIPGSQSGCGTLKCWDAGAIMLRNPTTAPVTVSKVVVNVHGSIKGGKIYDNLWGSFTVQPGQRVILTENPPHAGDNFNDFDTSGNPSACPPNPITVAPFVTFTIGGKSTTLTDSTHVLDTGGIDPGTCPNSHNESIPWRRIGTGSIPFSPQRVAASCPSPWACVDIGGPLPAGSQSYDSKKKLWTISAGGADITGLSDQFHFVYQKFAGNVSAITHVLTQSNTSPGAKAGVMIRTTKDPGSPNYALLVSPGEGIKVQVRKTLDGDTQKLANPTGTTPAWLKITRTGNTYTAYTSTNGTSWTLIAGSAITINLGSNMRVGMAVTSHAQGVLGSVTMSGVKLG